MNPDTFLKKFNVHKKNIGISLAATCVIFSVAAIAIPLKVEKTVNVFDSTVRLRVIANSDSKEDQALKLAVRDDIIGLAGEIFSGCNSIEDAINAVEQNRDTLIYAARSSLKAHGSSLPVTLSFGKEKCPVRRYSEFTFPAGEYLTLRINLGKAQGENWWCVMYPPLCVSAATREVIADKETFLNFGFSQKQIDALTAPSEKEIRFAFMELFR